MREVARRDVDHAAAQALGDALHGLTQAVVLERREARDSHAHEQGKRRVDRQLTLLRGVAPALAHEVPGNQRAVVELGRALAGDSGGNALRLGLVAEFANEALVIGGAVTGVRGAKARKVPRGPPTLPDMCG